MSRTIFDPIVANVSEGERAAVQQLFGRHVVEQRNRMAVLVRRWIESDLKHPLPIYDRLIDRVRALDEGTRHDIASIALLMADEIASAILIVFAGSDDLRDNGKCINYAIVAQSRAPDSDDVDVETDVNRGDPITPLWNDYKRWLNRFAPTELRATTSDAR